MKPGARSRGAVELARLGKTQAELAVRVSVSTGIIAMWLSGQRTPGLPNRKVLQKKFGIAIEAWDEEPTPSSPPAPPSRPPAWGDSSALARVERLQGIVDRALDQLENPQKGTLPMTPLERAKVMADLARTLGSIRRLKGEEVSEVKVLKHPKWQAIRDAILEELQDAPELLERVLARLQSDEDRRG